MIYATNDWFWAIFALLYFIYIHVLQSIWENWPFPTYVAYDFWKCWQKVKLLNVFKSTQYYYSLFVYKFSKLSTAYLLYVEKNKDSVYHKYCFYRNCNITSLQPVLTRPNITFWNFTQLPRHSSAIFYRISTQRLTFRLEWLTLNTPS